MNRTEIIAHLQISLSAVLNRDILELPENARLFDDLGLDSTSVIELLMALEDTINLEVDPDELEPEIFQTVGSLADYIEAGFVSAAAAV
jgi:acyl carrier protein